MQPLSKKSRLVSGIILAIIFFILVPIILANSFGYHLDRIGDFFTIVKTGGIYVASESSGVHVYVDGQYFKDSGLFVRNILIQDLKPNQNHHILTKKEGYYDWLKELPVYESIVTESRVLMLPTEIEKEEIYPFFDYAGVGTTTATSSGKLVKDKKLPENILIDGYIPTNSKYREMINVFVGEDFDVYSTSTIKTNSKIISETSNILNSNKRTPEYFKELNIEDFDKLENLIELSNQIAWLDNGNIILNWIDKNDTPYYFYCLDFKSCRKQIVVDWSDDILRFDFLPGRNDVFVVLVDSGIYAVEADDRSERNIQPIYLGEGLDFRKNNDNQIIVKDGLVFHSINF